MMTVPGYSKPHMSDSNRVQCCLKSGAAQRKMVEYLMQITVLCNGV